MSTVKFRDYEIYYEVYGQGKPLVILNGIMMSAASWKPFIEQFSADNQLVLIDFLDQGQSSRLDGIAYKHDLQVAAVKAVVDYLQLQNISLFGISYGGEIAIQFALRHQHLCENLLLFNTTAWTSPWLEEIGNGWNRAARDPQAYYAMTIPVIYSPQFYTREIAWMTQRKEKLLKLFAVPSFIDGMIRLTDSSVGYDKRDQIRQIKTRTLVVSSQYDFVTPTHEQEFLVSQLEQVNYVVIPNCGHASMYEMPHLFSAFVLGFILKNNHEYHL